METFKRFLANEEKKKSTYDYSSTQVNLPEPLARDVIRWGRREIPEKDILHDPNDKTFGRELEPHVTVLYGIHTEKPVLIRKLLKDQQQFEIELGKISVFENDTFDVVKIEVKSADLVRLNRMFNEHLYTTQIYPEYKPHVTVAYLHPGCGGKYDGDKYFQGKIFMATDVVFSAWSGEKTTIRMKAGEGVAEKYADRS